MPTSPSPEAPLGSAFRFNISLEITGDAATRLGEVPQLVIEDRAERAGREHTATTRLLAMAESVAPLLVQFVADAFKPKRPCCPDGESGSDAAPPAG